MNSEPPGVYGGGESSVSPEKLSPREERWLLHSGIMELVRVPFLSGRLLGRGWWSVAEPLTFREDLAVCRQLVAAPAQAQALSFLSSSCFISWSGGWQCGRV